MNDPDTRAVFTACMRETESLARARGIDLAPDVVEKTLAIFDGVPAGFKPSMALDLEQGRRLEVDALQGTAVRMGRELGLSMPVNEVIYAALKHHEGGAP